MLPPPIKIGLYIVALVFIVICVGTAMGALSNAQKDKKKAKDQGLVAFAFCLLASVLIGAVKVIG